MVSRRQQQPQRHGGGSGSSIGGGSGSSLGSSSAHAASELARTTRTMEGEMAILRPGSPASDLRSGVPLPGGAVPLPGSPGLKKFDPSKLIGPGEKGRGPIRRPQLASGGRKLRSDLLHKLGIDEAASKGKRGDLELKERNRATADRSLLGDMPSSMTALKYDPIWEEELDGMVSAAAGETDEMCGSYGGTGTASAMMGAVVEAREIRSAPGSRASSPPRGSEDASGPPPAGSWQDGLASLFSSLSGGNSQTSSNGPSGTNSAKPSPPSSDIDEASVTSVDSQPQTLLENQAAVAKHATHLGPGRRRKLTFGSGVKVTPIPMRTEYSDRVRERLWSNRLELHENAQRNAVEFASEGWDWRTVTEDEGMYRCAVSGELIHPVHCQTPYHE